MIEAISGLGPVFECGESVANIGPNSRRSLTGALKRFASMLIEEARDVGGFTFAELDTMLDLAEGTTSRYSQRKRAPNAEDIQDLENKVARLLKRPAHVVVIEANDMAVAPYAELVVGEPDKNLNLRAMSAEYLQFGYEGDWPTYRRLTYSSPRGGVRLIHLYAWQWGILWDRGVLPSEWTRAALGIPEDAPVESFLPAMVEAAKLERAAAWRAQAALYSAKGGGKPIELPEFCRKDPVNLGDSE